ncbi:MAG TPA: hypothetical protein O0X27_04675 [Methanocorpusculum sp.]|nr:hypothetical protein [Methanocorpusculum sp.]
MTVFTDLEQNLASVFVVERTGRDGRIEEEWICKKTISCRFSQPRTSQTNVAAGMSEEHIDATIYAGPDLLPAITGTELPIYFHTNDPGWTGTWEMRTPPKIRTDAAAQVHHVECSVLKMTSQDESHG